MLKMTHTKILNGFAIVRIWAVESLPGSQQDFPMFNKNKILKVTTKKLTEKTVSFL